jgi:hypothetical protein
MPILIPADFNNNRVVVAADYVVWRKGVGTTYTQNDYNIWRTHFGQSAGSGSGVSATDAITEPVSVVLLMAAATCPNLRRSRVNEKVPATH